MSTPCKHYNECGCEVSSCCLECPLAVCVYEEPHGGKTIQNLLQDIRIAHLRDEGRSVRWISEFMNLSTSAIFKSLARSKSSVVGSLTDTTRRATIDVAAIAVSDSGR